MATAGVAGEDVWNAIPGAERLSRVQKVLHQLGKAASEEEAK